MKNSTWIAISVTFIAALAQANADASKSASDVALENGATVTVPESISKQARMLKTDDAATLERGTVCIVQ